MSVSAAVRAVPPTARSINWGPLAGATAALTMITAALRPWDGHTLSLSMTRLAVGLASAAAVFSIDDQAAATVAASPTALALRRATRLIIAIATASFIVGGACFTIAALGGVEQLPADRVVLESVGMVLAAMACAAAVGGDRGVCLFLAALLGALIVQQRFPAYALFPFEPSGPTWDRAGVAWAVIATASATVLVILSRDPVSRRHQRRSAG